MFTLITRVRGKSSSRQVREYKTRAELDRGVVLARKRGRTNFWIFEGDELIEEFHDNAVTA